MGHMLISCKLHGVRERPQGWHRTSGRTAPVCGRGAGVMAGSAAATLMRVKTDPGHSRHGDDDGEVRARPRR
jgi:hypothetical protein